MNKTLFKSLAFFLTFLTGIGIVAAIIFYMNQSSEELVVPEPPIIADCGHSKNFPGLSKRLGDIQAGKSGYFPKQIFQERFKGADDLRNNWYGKHLQAMNEKSLLKSEDHDLETYRFLWLRSFNHPVFVRIVNRANHLMLYSRELNGAGGYEPGKPIRTVTKKINQEEWCGFIQKLNQTGFWNMPTESDDLLGVDGAEWILEGVKEGRYHLVDRWSPYGGDYQEACIYLLRLSGVDTVKMGDELY